MNEKVKEILGAFLVVLLSYIGVFILKPIFASKSSYQGYKENKLNAIPVTNVPVVDGVVDSIWNDVPELTIRLGETYDVHDPASITDCAGCHSFKSDVTVSLKAVYTTDRIYILETWPDSTASFSRGDSWTFADGKWQKLNPDQSEDRLAFFWPIGEITGTHNTSGCMAKCHTYYPIDTDPHESIHGIVDDAWLENGRADIWHEKTARGSALISASGLDLTIDPVTHEVTGGTFSMTGYVDDKYVDVWAPDSINGEDGGRYGDAGVSAYSYNRISDKSRPKYIEKAPVDYADAMFLTQGEIDAGECSGDPDTGVSVADATTCWPAYASLNAVVPERILVTPKGSRADIEIGAVWHDGFWTAEIVRDLKTNNEDDIQFDTSMEYLFGVAEFENSRHGYEHRTSQMYYLTFTI